MQLIQGDSFAGVITFAQNSTQNQLQITVNITGLPVGQGNVSHGLHVHQNSIQIQSDIATIRCGSAGPHFNPLNKTHGDIKATNRHVGDYGNIVSDNNGNILTTFNDTLSTLYGPLGIIGRTIVLHQSSDDLGLGNSSVSSSTGKLLLLKKNMHVNLFIFL